VNEEVHIVGRVTDIQTHDGTAIILSNDEMVAIKDHAECRARGCAACGMRGWNPVHEADMAVIEKWRPEGVPIVKVIK
jgi:hypothetical protein